MTNRKIITMTVMEILISISVYCLSIFLAYKKYTLEQISIGLSIEDKKNVY